MGKAAAVKVPVTERALFQRVNRKLAKESQRICKSRPFYDGEIGPYYNSDLGEYYGVDVYNNSVAFAHVDLEKLGRELGVLAPWEALAEEDE